MQALSLGIEIEQLPWHLHLFGDFRLFDPQGMRVSLDDRKVEGLLGILALHRELGIARATAAEILWPGKPPQNQLTSLRQALSRLRKVMHDQALEVSRAQLRLNQRFPLECDFYETELRDALGFMPDHSGGWFDSIRSELSTGRAANDGKRSSLIDSFLQTARLLGEVDPIGMIRFINANPTISRGIQSEDLKELLNHHSPDSEVAGWMLFWQGSLEDDLLISIRLLREALMKAKESNDLELASQICPELGRAYSRVGNLTRAEKTCAIADMVAEQLGTRAAKAQAHRLRGTFLTHWNNPEAGLKLLELAETLTDDLVSRTQLQAVNAHFLSSIGRFDEAAKKIEACERNSIGLGHFGIELNLEMTRLLLKAASTRTSDCVTELENAAARAYAVGSSQFGVYFDEMLAKVYFLNREKEQASQRIGSAVKARRSTNMIKTEIESRRVALLK